MAKHFERQGKSPYAYHAVSFTMLVIEYSYTSSSHLYTQYCVWELNSLLHCIYNIVFLCKRIVMNDLNKIQFALIVKLLNCVVFPKP